MPHDGEMDTPPLTENTNHMLWWFQMLVLFLNKYIARTNRNRFLENRGRRGYSEYTRILLHPKEEIEILNIKGIPRGFPILARAREPKPGLRVGLRFSGPCVECSSRSTEDSALLDVSLEAVWCRGTGMRSPEGGGCDGMACGQHVLPRGSAQSGRRSRCDVLAAVPGARIEQEVYLQR